MQANKTHVSFETAKLLKDCGVESKCGFFTGYDGVVYIAEYGDKTPKYLSVAPAFTWQEILWEHAEEFFGDKRIFFHDDYNEPKEDITGETSFIERWEMANIVHSHRIMVLLQQKKYDEADLYFREHCILIKK